jgi:hypothetical protein
MGCLSASANEIQLMSNQQPDNATLKRWVQEAAGWVKEIGWPAFKNDEWLPILVRKSFKSYYENASAAYSRRKYPGQTKDAIVKKLTIVAAKNAAMLGAITGAFGARVADIVAACTDAVTLLKPPWRERKEKYSAHLKDADAGTLLVSASDKLHNARAILADLRKDGDGVWSRFMGGKEGTLWYYRSLVTAFRQHGTSELIEELDRVVSEMERLAADSRNASKSGETDGVAS